jgi:hypothetical protein
MRKLPATKRAAYYITLLDLTGSKLKGFCLRNNKPFVDTFQDAVLIFSRTLSGMWRNRQTQQTQNLPIEMLYGFKSHHPHQLQEQDLRIIPQVLFSFVGSINHQVTTQIIWFTERNRH